MKINTVLTFDFLKQVFNMYANLRGLIVSVHVFLGCKCVTERISSRKIYDLDRGEAAFKVSGV